MNTLSTSVPLTYAMPQTVSQLSSPFVLVRDLAGLKRHAAELEALADQSTEPNIFYEPWMLFPALEQFAGSSRLLFLLVFAGHGKAGDNPELRGFFPLEEKRFYRSFPLKHLALWRYPHCFLSTPLLHRDHVAPTLRAFSDWFRSNTCYRLMEMTQISAHGPFHNDLDSALLPADSTFNSQRYERATLHLERDFDSYLSRHTSARFRKKLRRKHRALARLGEVEYRELQPSDNPAPWIDQFLALERSGWKGRAGTALAINQADRMFFHSITRAAFQRQRLSMVALYLGDRPIAMAVNLLSGDGVFAFKISYDEDYSEHSPGVLLDMEMVRRLHEQPASKWIDCCSDFNVTSFNRLFVDQKPIRNLVVSNGGATGNLIVRMIPALKRLRNRELT